MTEKCEWLNPEHRCFLCGEPSTLIEKDGTVQYCSQECMDEQQKGFEDFLKEMFGEWWDY